MNAIGWTFADTTTAKPMAQGLIDASSKPEQIVQLITIDGSVYGVQLENLQAVLKSFGNPEYALAGVGQKRDGNGFVPYYAFVTGNYSGHL